MDYDRRYAARYRRVFQAMSLDQAKQVLGFPPSAYPSPEEIQKAYRAKAMENHPDRGGKHEVMVDLNAAKDILQGKRREDRHPPVSWSEAAPSKADPEVARRAEEARKREQALLVISRASEAAVSAATLAINGTDLIGHRINFATFLDGDYRSMLDKMHDDIEAQETVNKDMAKAQGLLHTLTGMSHRLSQKFSGIIRMGGEAHAALIGLGGAHLTWLSVAAIYFEMKKFFTAFTEFDKVDGQLQSLIVTSDFVPNEWVDLSAHPRGIIVSFRNDFKGFGDHRLKQFGMVMQKASKETMGAAGPYGFKHHGDWQQWHVPGDFEAAQKVVLASASN
jgi:hypothetical protein